MFMKTILSFFLLLFLFSSFSLRDVDDCTLTAMEESEAVTTLVRICDFKRFIGGPGSFCANGTIPLRIYSDCSAEFEAIVRTVNLDSEPVIGVTYSLPPDAPEMYCEYTTLSDRHTQTIGPITGFQYKGERHPTTGLHIFEFDTNMFINVEDECSIADNPIIPMEVRLVDEKGALYPVEAFAGSDQMFYCEVFAETCSAGDCSTNTGCTEGPGPVYDVGACGACYECGAQDRSTKSEEATLGELVALTVRPNPFTNTLQLDYQLIEEAVVNVEIVNANGATVQQLDPIKQNAGEHFLNINTEQLSNGVYFCRVKIGEEIFVEKIVKLK